MIATITDYPALGDLLQATRSDPPFIALGEGADPRVVQGALAALSARIARIILVGGRDEIAAALAAQGHTPGDDLLIHDPATSDLIPKMAATFHNLRKHKGVDAAKAARAVRDPLIYAAMLVRLDYAAGTVGGAVATTPDVVRAAIQVIGPVIAKGDNSPMVSSFFLMIPPAGAPAPARPMVYADCGLVINPDATEQIAIAAAASASCRSLLGVAPKVAFLSFSTKGSAVHPMVKKVADAAAGFAIAHPDILSDGELQFDAAFLPAVATAKSPESATAGQANVMVFPSLDAGNIAYKITQRLAGYAAIGPILQGLAKPANDLSRGCSAQDVTTMIAVTVRQALGRGADASVKER